MAKNPADDVAAQLLAASPVGGVALVREGSPSPNLFLGPLRPVSSPGTPAGLRIPARALFVLATGGMAPQPYMDARDVDLHRGNVQILIRTEVDDYPGGVLLANGVRDALQRRAPAGYQGALAQGEPVWLQKDEQGCHLFSLNVQLWWQE